MGDLRHPEKHERIRPRVQPKHASDCPIAQGPWGKYDAKVFPERFSSSNTFYVVS